VTRRDLARAIELRDALHRAIRDTELAPLGPVLAGVRLAAVVVDHDLVLGASGGGPVDLVAARLVSAVLQARHDGSWTRLKTCHHCGWVFYDTSKNRSGRWCSMQACGGRAKARAYRRRVVAVSRPAARG
jgi:predicted RNA-binding Zn ribbon-like protein